MDMQVEELIHKDEGDPVKQHSCSFVFIRGWKFLVLISFGVPVLLPLAGCDRPAKMNAAAPVPNVQIIRPKRGEITRSITLPGDVLAWQQATLYAQVPGYLKTITVDKGDRVQQGALLAEIEVPEMIADLAKNKTDVEVAAIDIKRVSEALKKAPDLMTPQTVDDAKGKYLVAKANLQ